MKPRALKRYRRPGYPTKSMVMKDPELLKKSLRAFKFPKAGLAPALALFVASSAGGTGCVASSSCMVVLPPVYLSEEEAMEIIRDQFSGYGVNLSVDPNDLSALELEAVEPDAVDLDLSIAVEFISKEDCVALGGGEEEEEYCDFYTVQSDMQDAVAAENPDVIFEAFSDPARRDEGSAETYLREQVDAFAAWLQSEGVI